jgi:hypothetical protein
MAKFYGEIGFAETSETAPGVWEQSITEHFYSGDVIRNTQKWQRGEGLNDNVEINNIISIIADPYAYQNLSTMRYVKWMGVLWKISNIDVQRPRLLLGIGGVYNGPTPTPTPAPD